MKDLRQRLAGTGQLLVRSGIETGAILERMCRTSSPITAMLESGEQLFISTLLEANLELRRVVIAACTTNKRANHALLAEEVLLFGCNLEGTHYEFAAENPQAWEHGGTPAIKLDFPAWLLGVQRRARARVAVPASVRLRCEVPWGPLSFEVQVVDISTQGLGGIIYDPAIHLEPGMHLKGVRVQYAGREPIRVDLIVRDIGSQPLPDGSIVMRAGCSFVGASDDMEALVRLFVTEVAP